GTAIPSSPTDQLLTSGLRNGIPGLVSPPAVASFTGILTDPQFRVVLKAIEQRDGADLLNEGQVTTLSGRQAQFQVVDVVTIVAGNDSGQNNSQNAQPAGGGNGGTVIQNVGVQVNFTTETDPFGTTLDVVPYVCAD